MPKLLIVEDSLDYREALSVVFRSEGWDVSACADGRQALSVLDAGLVPAAVLLDLAMPGMDGLEVLDAMRSNSKLQATPVIVLTANANQPHLSQEVLRRGANACLTKFVSVEGIIQAVAQFKGA